MTRFVLTIIFLLTFYAQASADYWVSLQGSDANACFNTAEPQTTGAKLTVQSVIDNCNLQPGDVVSIRGGTYDQNVKLWHNIGGTASSPITFKAHTGETPIFTPTSSQGLNGVWELWDNIHDIIFDGINIDNINSVDFNGPPNGVALFEHTNRITWQNSFIRNNGRGMGVMARQHELNENWTFRGNVISFNGDRDNGVEGGHEHGFYGCFTSSLFEFNTVHSNGGNGFSMGCNSYNGGTIRFNTVYNNGTCALPGMCITKGNGTGIWLTDGVWIVHNNTIFGARSDNLGSNDLSAASGIAIYGTCGNPGAPCVIYNNTFYGNGGPAIHAQAIPGVGPWVGDVPIIRNNIAFGNLAGSGTAGNVGQIGHRDNTESPVYSHNFCGAGEFGDGCATFQNPRLANPTINPATADFRKCIGSGNPHASCTEASLAIDFGTTNICTTCSPQIIITVFGGNAPDAGYDETDVGGGGGDPIGTIVVSGESFPGGGPLTCTVEITSGGTTGDWAGTFPAAGSGSSFSADWKYLNGLQTPPGSPVTEAVVLSFTAPLQEGSYQCRVYSNDSVLAVDLIDSDDFGVQPSDLRIIKLGPAKNLHLGTGADLMVGTVQ